MNRHKKGVLAFALVGFVCGITSRCAVPVNRNNLPRYKPLCLKGARFFGDHCVVHSSLRLPGENAQIVLYVRTYVHIFL